jgi:hypothetical protein
VISGLIFPDVNEYHPVTDFDKASKAGIVGYRGRDDSADNLDARGKFHYNGFAGRGLVELIYTVENCGSGAVSYQRLKASFPWRPGVIYTADVEQGGLSMTEARDFIKAAHADGRPACVYGLASSMIDATDVKWIARYSLPQPTGADIWQFNGGGSGLDPETFPGVAGNCDMNKLIAPLDDLKRLSGMGADVLDAADKKFIEDNLIRLARWLSTSSENNLLNKDEQPWVASAPTLSRTASEIAKAVVAALPASSGTVDLDVLTDLIVSRLGTKLST